MVAIGGWGDTAGFDIAAVTETTRKLFAHNVKQMVDATGADGKQNELNWNSCSDVVQVLTLIGNTRGGWSSLISLSLHCCCC